MCGRSRRGRCAGRSGRIFSTSAILATTAIAVRRASGRCGCIWSTDAAVRATMRTMRLLIAEDDADLRQVLSDLLQQSGYSVDGCTDGTAALSALLSGQSALGIVDIGLPGLSGLELVRALRNRGGSVPILIVTAREAPHERGGGPRAGAGVHL